MIIIGSAALKFFGWKKMDVYGITVCIATFAIGGDHLSKERIWAISDAIK